MTNTAFFQAALFANVVCNHILLYLAVKLMAEQAKGGNEAR